MFQFDKTNIENKAIDIMLKYTSDMYKKVINRSSFILELYSDIS